VIIQNFKDRKEELSYHNILLNILQNYQLRIFLIY